MERRQLKVVIPLLGVATAAAGLLLSTLSNGSPSSQSSAQAPAVLVQTAQSELTPGYHYVRELTGRVQASRSSDLGFDLAGRLIEVRVNEGSVVSQGEILARLDNERLKVQFRELLEALKEAEANLALAEITQGRMTNIVEKGAVSRQSSDEAQMAWRAAKARLAQIRIQIESVEVELANTELHAPFSGVITARLMDEGSVLSAGRPVLTLQEMGTPEIRVGVAGRLIDYLRVGESYSFQWREQEITAKLRAVLPLRSATTRTVETWFDPINAPSALRNGDLVRLRLSEFIDEPGRWLPLAALTEGRRGLWSVYIAQAAESAIPPTIQASHQVQRRTVEVIHQEADRVFVRGSLGGNDEVILDGLQRLVPSQWVRLAPVKLNAADHVAMTKGEAGLE